MKNLQGDVVQIRSIYGTVVVEYTYDAWGNVLSITGMYADTLGVNNPIRYRGYYQDFETGFYYLQSRYYDPAVRRFINADGYINANDDLLGYNMYAYCGNNPVNRNDDGGMFWDTIFDVVSLVASVVEVVANPTDPWAWAGLVGDAIDLIPFVSGVGETTKAIKVTMGAVTETADSLYDASRTADRFADSIGTYKDLKKLNKGSGLEVHHIVEKRFARSISPNLKQSEMLSVALDPVEHRAFTNAWRTNLPYGKADYGVNEIWVAAQKIYANYPSLLEAARKTIWGN